MYEISWPTIRLWCWQYLLLPEAIYFCHCDGSDGRHMCSYVLRAYALLSSYYGAGKQFLRLTDRAAWQNLEITSLCVSTHSKGLLIVV